MAEHTPEPWTRIGDYIYDASSPNPIATVHYLGRTLVERDANARLITCAPETAKQHAELLEACEFALRNFGLLPVRARGRLEAAIAKAKGLTA